MSQVVHGAMSQMVHSRPIISQQLHIISHCTHVIGKEDNNVGFSLWSGRALDQQIYQTSNTQPQQLHLLSKVCFFIKSHHQCVGGALGVVHFNWDVMLLPGQLNSLPRYSWYSIERTECNQGGSLRMRFKIRHLVSILLVIWVLVTFYFLAPSLFGPSKQKVVSSQCMCIYSTTVVRHY